MDSIYYNEGVPGYTPLGVDGIDGAAGKSVHFSTISLDDSSTIKECILGGLPLSDNPEVRSSGEYETYNVSDVIIDDYGKFGIIQSVSPSANFNVLGTIIKQVNSSTGDGNKMDSSFADISELNFNYSDNDSSKWADSRYDRYVFSGSEYGGDGINLPLYSYRKIGSDKKRITEYRITDSSTMDFINSNLYKCEFAKIAVTFSTGLVYEKIVPGNATSNDIVISIDNRYYYGYGRGTDAPINSSWGSPLDADYQYNSLSDSSIWQEYKITSNGQELNAAAHTCGEDSYMTSDLCHHITQIPHTIVDAHMDFHHKDGHTYTIKIKFND